MSGRALRVLVCTAVRCAGGCFNEWVWGHDRDDLGPAEHVATGHDRRVHHGRACSHRALTGPRPGAGDDRVTESGAERCGGN